MNKTTKNTTAKTQAVKDAGRVKLGAGMIHFSDTTPAKKATKDSGRVRLGAGMLRF